MRMAVFALASLSAAACATVGVEEPAFSLIREDGAFEIREYAPTIVAETTLAGEAVNTRNAGFQPLADYIFAKDRKGDQIAMTAPVTQAPRQKIAMTAPVTQESSAAGWTIAFTMPAGYTMETLPAPANPAVRLLMKCMLGFLVVGATYLLYFSDMGERASTASGQPASSGTFMQKARGSAKAQEAVHQQRAKETESLEQPAPVPK